MWTNPLIMTLAANEGANLAVVRDGPPIAVQILNNGPGQVDIKIGEAASEPLYVGHVVVVSVSSGRLNVISPSKTQISVSYSVK